MQSFCKKKNIVRIKKHFMKLNSGILILFLSLFFYDLQADNIEFTAKAPSKIGINQTFQVQFIVNKQGTNIQPGDYSGFKLVGGPSVSTSQSIQIINGNMSQSTTYTYTYTFQALNVGTFTIGPGKITIDGKTYNSNTLRIEVQKDPVQSQNPRSNRRGYDPWADFYNDFFGQPQQVQPKEITAEDLFARVIVDKTTAYKGEPIIATIKIYTTVDLIGFKDIKLPAFDAFYAEEIESPERIYFTKEIINNRTYNTALLKKYILYPRVTGNVKIEKADFDCEVRVLTSQNMWFGNYQTENKKISTPEINITVKPLTSPPSTFTGAIGRFDFKIEKSADTVNVNDAITFKFIVFGTGNFNMIETPKLVWPKEFDVYDPVVNEKTSVTSNGVTGSKTWEYTLIPRFPGKYNLGKFNFTYYDLNTHQYKTIETKEVIFAVRRDKNDTKFDDKSYNYSQKGIEYIGDEDIRYIKTKNFNLYKTNNLITKTGVFPFLFIVPAVIFIVVIILLRKIIKERSNIVKLKQRNAGKVSRRRLKKARKYLQSRDNEKFYKEIISTLWGFAGDRLGIPVADLTKDKIINVLESLNADSQLSKNFIDLIDLCEFAHFAPVQTEQDKQEIYKKAAEIIEKLDQVL